MVTFIELHMPLTDMRLNEPELSVPFILSVEHIISLAPPIVYDYYPDGHVKQVSQGKGCYILLDSEEGFDGGNPILVMESYGDVLKEIDKNCYILNWKGEEA